METLLYPPRPVLNWRTAKNFVGKTIQELCNQFKYLPSDQSSITKQRLASTITAIRVKKAYGAQVHIINNNGEWVTIMLPFPATNEGQEAYIHGLSASPKEWRVMFGCDS